MKTYEECKRIITAVIDGENPNWYKTLKARKPYQPKKKVEVLEFLPLWETKSAGTYLSNASDTERYNQTIKELGICLN